MFALIVAITFGVVQILCACLPDSGTVQTAVPENTDVAVAHQAHNLEDMPDVILLADLATSHAGHTMAEPMPEGHCDPDPQHDHAENCSHCDGTSAVDAKADLTNAPLLDLPSQSVTLTASALPSPHRAGMAGSALHGLRWRDPPQPTPVTLKTLALI
ncbi:MAG: hypothetical protein WBA35_09375 [Litorimonas sp.]